MHVAMQSRLLCVVPLCIMLCRCTSATKTEVSLGLNPVRRIVNMLQSMQRKVTEEGKRDQKLYNQYTCYCETGGKNLEESVRAAEEKSPRLTSSLNEARARKEQLESDLKGHKADLEQARQALSSAKAIREKDSTAYNRELTDTQTNIGATGSAMDAVKKGMAGAFLQTPMAGILMKVAQDMDIATEDREEVLAFLQNKASEDSDPVKTHSSSIVGILDDMKEDMEKHETTMVAEEKEAKASFESMSAAKDREVKATVRMIEDKTARLGKVGVDIENLREDLEDTSATYVEDKKFLVDLDKSCATKDREYNEVVKTRAEEMVALGNTIRVLNDDDALELFKSTLGQPAALLQVGVATAKQLRRQASAVLRASQRKKADPRLDFILLAMRGKRQSFGQVLEMIQSMSAVLKKEQVADADKREYCRRKMDKADDTGKELLATISDLGKIIEDTSSAADTLGEEIQALSNGIRALDQSVAEATRLRKEENMEYQKTRAADSAAKQLLKIAINRMNKFYNPKLYKEKTQELTRQRRIAVNFGAEAEPVFKPTGIADTDVTAAVKTEPMSFAQVAAHAQRARDLAPPPPPPEAVAAYRKKGEESGGVLAMLNMLARDLEKEITELETEEKDGQADYENYIRDSAEKRTLDSKTLEEKEGTKAAAEAMLQKSKLEKKSKNREAFATSVVMRDLHLECDFLLASYETRKQARAGELESLGKAHAVLSDANYEFTQLSASHRLLKKRHVV